MNPQYLKIKNLIIFLIPIIFQFAQPLFRISAQEIISGNKKYNETIFTLRIKQFNEFIERFNYEKDFLNKKIDEDFASKISRSEYISLLFNEEDLRLDTSNTNQYKKLIEEFISEVEDSSYRINKYSEKIFIELNCVISCNDKTSYIQLLLNQEINKGLKWTICAINKEFIDELHKTCHFTDSNLISFVKYDSTNYIPPYSNETNFIVLKKLLNKKNKNLSSLNSSYFNSDRNNIFYYLINQGIIKFHHVDKISYHILDIPGWSIVINNFIRNTENSGWLISDLKTIDSKNYQYFKEEFDIEISD